MDKFGKVIKEIMKAELKDTVESSWQLRSIELQNEIRGIVAHIIEWEWDKRLLEIRKEVATQASVEAKVPDLISKVCNDAVQHAKPRIDEAVEAFRRMIYQATAEAIQELIRGEIEKGGHATS